MTLFQRLVAKPRSFAARGWIFQIHLYTGLFLALYALMIGATGSVLVFEPEIRDWQDRELLTVEESGTQVPVEQVIASVHEAYAGLPLGLLHFPDHERGTFRVSVGKPSDRRTVYLHPYTARILGSQDQRQGFLVWLARLHFDLLGGSTGRVVNGVGALLMLLLSATGIVIWWPGKAHWARAISINWATRWKRVNYDIHSALGFFTLLFVVLLSLTGAYFAWPKQSQALVSRFSPVQNYGSAPVLAAHGPLPQIPMSELLQVAQRQVPDAWLQLLLFPSDSTQPLRVFLMTGAPRDYETTSIVYLDPCTAEVLRVEPAKGRSFGDALIAWIPALHFGTFGGVPVKILWFLLGLSPVILGVSGALMWWNRVAVKKVSKWRRDPRRAYRAPKPEEVAEEVCS